VAANCQSAPMSTGQLATRYRSFEKKVLAFSAKCEMTSSFEFQGVACTSRHTFEVRRSNGVTNIFGVRTATIGFTPTYRHSDGQTHQGIDPSEAEMQFSSGSQHLWLTVRHDKPTAVLGARIITSDDGVADPVLEGRRFPHDTDLDVHLIELKNGKYEATLQYHGSPPETIEVDPKLDYMITSRLVGAVAAPQSWTEIESVVNVDGLFFPSRIVRKSYKKDGSLDRTVTFEYGDSQVKRPVELWMSRLPEGMTILGGASGVHSTDSSGKIIRVGTKRKKQRGFDWVVAMQFASLVGMFSFGGLLLHQLLRRRGRSRVVQ